MPFRLVAQDGERSLAFPLAEGEHLVGAGEDCAVRLRHPTVSRRHARLVVTGGRLTVEDLGSRNGTRIDGERLELPATIDSEATLSFGSQACRVEAVEERDLVAGVSFAPQPEPAEGVAAGPSRSAPPTTAGFGSLSDFTLERLPALLARLEERPDRPTMAGLAGEALFATLPCLWVEVTARSDDDERGILFRAARADTAPAEGEAPWGAGGAVRAGFLHENQARTFRPLLETAASLLRLSGAGPRGEAPARDDTAPPSLPDPPTVVPEMLRLYRDAARVARGDVGVLITGESGTGKEVLARYLHAASPRARQPFVALNCAALPRDLLEAELFGVERGVATGVEARAGRFEQADGGTLFLDEVGDMAAETQARILRVLQEGEVYRLGGQAPRSARVRVVAATNRDLDAMVEAGTFRTDLYHRIADWRVELPPLRERRADIPNLAAWFLARETARHGLGAAGISLAALERLEACRWPGNVRQLEREMARSALFLEPGQLLQTVHLHEDLRTGGAARPTGTLRERLEAVERREIERALENAGGQAQLAARELGIGRTTLYRRMKELGVSAGGHKG
jgi:DNA-binding NtrC family response regulator